MHQQRTLSLPQTQTGKSQKSIFNLRIGLYFTTKKLFCCLFLLLASFAQAFVMPEERITLFESNITIHSDGKITIVEKITINVTGSQIKHGIFREFPTKYRDKFGNTYTVDFCVNEICINNRPTPYQIKNQTNGKRIYIGDPNKFISPGRYTFLISYATNNQLGYFKDHDELYWNVTGCEWEFFIEHVVATVNLPEMIHTVPDKISLMAYTGFYGNGKLLQKFN